MSFIFKTLGRRGQSKSALVCSDTHSRFASSLLVATSLVQSRISARVALLLALKLEFYESGLESVSEALNEQKFPSSLTARIFAASFGKVQLLSQPPSKFYDQIHKRLF